MHLTWARLPWESFTRPVGCRGSKIGTLPSLSSSPVTRRNAWLSKQIANCSPGSDFPTSAGSQVKRESERECKRCTMFWFEKARQVHSSVTSYLTAVANASTLRVAQYGGFGEQIGQWLTRESCHGGWMCHWQQPLGFANLKSSYVYHTRW